jgi:hypothetical protein
MLSSATVVLAASIVLGQADTSDIARRELKEFGDAMVGRWMGEITLVADMPGVGAKGDRLNGYCTIGWILDKTAIQWDWNVGSLTGRSITVWDARTKQIKEYGSDTGGKIFEKTVIKDGDKWVWKFLTTAADGTKIEETNTISITDDGLTHVHVGTNRTRGSEKLPDYRDVWKRVSK